MTKLLTARLQRRREHLARHGRPRYLPRAAQALAARLLMAFLATLACLPMPAAAAVFYLDNRVPYAQAGVPERRDLLDATGVIECTDGTSGTGFVVDISEYLDEAPDFQVVATAARVLYMGARGSERGECAFRPASSPGHYLRIRERLVGSRWNHSMDRDDWAFARIEAGKPRANRALKLRFVPAQALESLQDRTLWAVGLMPENGAVGVSTDCSLYFANNNSLVCGPYGDTSPAFIHSCDLLGGARGGPLAIRENGVFEVIGINTGESQEDRFGSLVGVPFDPQRDFFNVARRLDQELEDKLIAFVSRFGNVKSPTPAIQARRQLIISIQGLLNSLGFDAGPSDGLLRAKTLDAVRSFQTTLGITPTGRISEELLMLLRSR